jgi:hypothetical protein
MIVPLSFGEGFFREEAYAHELPLDPGINASKSNDRVHSEDFC